MDVTGKRAKKNRKNQTKTSNDKLQYLHLIYPQQIQKKIEQAWDDLFNKRKGYLIVHSNLFS